MATSPNGVEWKLLDGITEFLLPQFWRCQQGIFPGLGGDSIVAEVLFTDRIVLRKCVLADSSISPITLKFTMRVVNKRKKLVILGSDLLINGLHTLSWDLTFWKAISEA